MDVGLDRFWAEHPPGSLVVINLTANQSGGLELELSGGFWIRVFPNSSSDREHWRFFEVGSDRHLVVFEEPDG